VKILSITKYKEGYFNGKGINANALKKRFFILVLVTIKAVNFLVSWAKNVFATIPNHRMPPLSAQVPSLNHTIPNNSCPPYPLS